MLRLDRFTAAPTRDIGRWDGERRQAR